MASNSGNTHRPVDGQYRCLVSIQPRGTKPPIFAVHVLGVNMRFYRPLAEQLGEDQPIFGLWWLSRSGDSPGPPDAATVAARYAEELERRYPTGPLILAAVSLGSVVAFELAHRLRDRGREVLLLAMFDATGPDVNAIAPSVSAQARVHARELMRSPARYVEGRLRKTRARLTRRVEIVGLRLRRALRLPRGERLQTRAFIEGNAALQRSYDFRPYPGRAIVFKAGDDAFTRSLADHGMGWAEVITGRLEVAVVPGGHLSMLDDPNVEHLAVELASAASSALEEQGTAGSR